VFGRVNRPEQFALLCSLLLGLGAAGNLLAATPLAYAAETIGWRAAMAAMAGLTALSALGVFLLVRDPPRLEHPTAQGFGAGIIEILGIRALWPLLPLVAVGYAIVLAERGLWAGPYFSSVHGLNAMARGNALLVMAAAMSAGAILYAPLDRWLGTRKWIVVAGSAAAACCLLALALLSPGPTAAIAIMAALGGFGTTYGVLMAHGRSFIPDALLGRGITMLNILFIGGAGVLQPLSGAMMKRLADAPPAGAFATLHLAFALALIAALMVYLFSRERR